MWWRSARVTGTKMGEVARAEPGSHASSGEDSRHAQRNTAGSCHHGQKPAAIITVKSRPEDPSFFAVSQALGLHHQTVQRCMERTVAEGPMAALDDRPRPGREPTITLEARAWLACRKAKTKRLLAGHVHEHGPVEEHACLANLAQATVCDLDQEEVQPHKVRYYLEQRDPDFAEKMAEQPCICRQVKILEEAASKAGFLTHAHAAPSVE